MNHRLSPPYLAILHAGIITCLLLCTVLPAGVLAQSGGVVQQAIAGMTPAEKVGQLFLVSFTGTDVNETSEIYRLINDYHVGGITLRADRDNFTEELTVTNAQQMVNRLQAINSEAAKVRRVGRPELVIPLFIGISQEGGGYPFDQILSGVTPIPSQMALGATWNPDSARQAGAVLGKELSNIGFNMYYGLSLDVLTLADPSKNPDLSTRLFGSDPYWVGQMGRHYTKGLKEGSNGKLGVFAKHFPGRGGSDRQAGLEIPTIRRSLEELQSYELLPYLQVMGMAVDKAEQLDGILVGHIRYQGFQGNIRATTKPISFDQQALGQLLTVPEIDSWHNAGGLVLSDDLGTVAVRNFYDPAGQSFSPRLVARDAFIAGNDLLMMGNISDNVGGSNFESVTSTLEYFTQRYTDDANFARLVDDALFRILNKKLTLFGSFTAPLENNNEINVLVDEKAKFDMNFSIALSSATLLSPSNTEIDTVLPDPPANLDYIVFLTDDRTKKQCNTCIETPVLPTLQMQSTVNRLYGPLADGLVNPSHVSSYSFAELNLWLEDRLESSELPSSISRAEWIVISALDLPDGSQQLAMLRRFLSEKQGVLANKKVILFSFGAPYYLDSTDFSRLTAAYALYDPSDTFVTMAVRILFHELRAAGSSPVSIPGLGYDLITVTSPKANQTIQLRVLKENPKTASKMTPLPLTTNSDLLPAATVSPIPTVDPVFKVGDTVYVQTGVLLDNNDHQVPDGTPVRLTLTAADEYVQLVEAFTEGGVATAALRLDKAGFLQITATAETATISEIIQLDVNTQGSTIIIVTPTPDSTKVLSEPTPVKEEVTETSPAVTPYLDDRGLPTFVGWLLVVSVTLAGMFLAFIISSQIMDTQWSLRIAILALVGGLVVYNTIMLAGGQGDGTERGLVVYIQPVLVGILVGAGLGVGWYLLADRGHKAEK